MFFCKKKVGKILGNNYFVYIAENSCNMKHRLEINPGDKFGMFTVISECDKHILPSGQKIRKIKCLCECGTHADILLLHLVRNRIKSCGCAYRVRNGESGSKLYSCWYKMHERCKPEYFESHLYFKKGIRVCDEWKDYFTFKEWALKNGFKGGLQIDRSNNSDGYHPKNCRFVTNIMNVNNRDNTHYVEYKGENVSLSLKLHELGLHNHYYTIRARILRGWVPDKAIDTPIRKGNYHK